MNLLICLILTDVFTFNNDSTISFNITVCCTFMKRHILPSCVHFTKLSYWR